MPTENRAGTKKRYYFRANRRGDKIERQYVGPLSDPQVELIRRLDQNRRALKKLSIRAERQDDSAEHDRLIAVYELRDALIHLIWRESEMATTFHTNDRVRSRNDSLPSRDEFLALVSRAEDGSTDAQEEMRRLLDKHGELWEVVGDVGRLLENHLIGILAGNSAFRREAISRKMASIRGHLTGPNDGVLESFLVERVVITFLDLTIRQTRAVGAISATASRRRERLLDRSQRRHLESIEALREFRESQGIFCMT